MGRTVKIFDTTLRDGEQSPGCSMNLNEKIEVAKQLEALKVDIIEAGFAAASPGDAAAIAAIADTVRGAPICSLARCREQDIEAAWNSIRRAESARIHTFLATSPVHMEYKLKMTPEQVLESVAHNVAFAKKFCSDIEFSAEDATRSDLDFLCRVVETAIKAGATTINIPDTVGYMIPEEYAARIKYLREHTTGIENIVLSCHMHNDLGMAVANSLAGVEAGIDQIECTINGLGERAGNTAMEEVVMAIKMHGDDLDAYTGINPKEFTHASRLVSSITGMPVQANKAIVGANAFAHSSGIHQDGVIKNPETYEIISPEDVGAAGTSIILTARSGHAALRKRLADLGYVDIPDEKFEKIHTAFLDMADRKKEVYDEDLHSLMGEHDRNENAIYRLDSVQISCGQPLVPTATVKLTDSFGQQRTACDFGTGPIDAMYKAINKVVQAENDLTEYTVQSVTRGIDALGEVTIRITAPDGEVFTGRGSDGDITVSSAKAYVNALNRMLEWQRKESGAPAEGGAPEHI